MADQQAPVDASRNIGLAPLSMRQHIRPGAVFWVDDHDVQLVETRIEGHRRTFHDARPVIVLQALEHCQNARIKTLLVVPCSASFREPVPSWALKIEEMPPFTKSPIVALVSQAQPILKSELVTFMGHLSDSTLDSLWLVFHFNTSSLPGSAVPMPARP